MEPLRLHGNASESFPIEQPAMLGDGGAEKVQLRAGDKSPVRPGALERSVD